MPRRSALLLVTAIYLGFSQAAPGAAAEIAQTGDRVQLTAQASSALPLLKPGSEGAAVEDLQSRLQRLGYYEGAIDGVYRDSTQEAVAAFQAAQDLSVDGRVGSDTWRQLEEALTAVAEPSPSPQPSASPSPDVAASPAEPAPASQPNWAMLGLGALAAASVGYWLHRRRASPRLRSLPGAAVVQAIDTPARDISVEPGNNGHHVLPSAAPDEVQAASTQPPDQAVQETTRLPKIDIAEELLKELQSPDPVQRRKAIWELGQRGDSEAIQPLVDLMMDSDSHQRSLILAAISEIGVRALKPLNRALLISLQDESSDVRKNAIRDLTRIYDLVVQISQLLGHAVNDPDTEVQETARWAIGQLNRIRTVTGVDGSPMLTNAATDYLPSDKSPS